MKFFEPCGKINFVRMAGDETQPTRFAFVEFADPKSVTLALSMNGGMLGDRPVKLVFLKLINTCYNKFILAFKVKQSLDK